MARKTKLGTICDLIRCEIKSSLYTHPFRWSSFSSSECSTNINEKKTNSNQPLYLSRFWLPLYFNRYYYRVVWKKNRKIRRREKNKIEATIYRPLIPFPKCPTIPNSIHVYAVGAVFGASGVSVSHSALGRPPAPIEYYVINKFCSYNVMLGDVWTHWPPSAQPIYHYEL